LLEVGRTLAIALAGALLGVWLRIPLPWFVGPLAAVALYSLTGHRLAAPTFGRDAGQWIIGTALGLYFTPMVVRQVIELAPWVALNTLFFILLGLAGAWSLRRLTGESGTTAFFAAAIGGASEMATQAELHGARVDRVAAAHSLRVMMVAVIVPFAMQFSGAHGADPYEPVAARFDWAGMAALAAVTGGGAIVLQRLRLPNAWMLGPLLVAGALTANGYSLSNVPTALVNAGQLLIGVALGARFTAEFFRAAPRYLAAVAVITLGYLALSALFGVWLAYASGLAPATAVLAATPGGVGEMALTAKLLQLGAPIVTAFHCVRIVLIVLGIGGLYRVLARLSKRRAA
jgi:membrane AbrB-like protein